MADIVNTLRGPRFYKPGTIRGLTYIIPVMHEATAVDLNCYLGRDTHEREYYQLGTDGEWHWTHTEASTFQKYPCYQEPEWTLPLGL